MVEKSPLPRILVNRRQAAEMMGVSVDTIRRWQHSGLLRARSTKMNKGGEITGVTLYAVRDLEALVDKLPEA